MRRWRNEYDGYERRSRWDFGRSGWATAIVGGLLLLTFGVAWRAHQRARFHRLTAVVTPQTTSAPMPGGQDAILLSRVALLNDSEPEFVSATVLPGIGMQLLQTTVSVPDATTQDLLAAVPLSDAARLPIAAVSGAPFHLRVSSQHLGERGGEDIIDLAPAVDAKNQTLVDGGQATGSFRGSGANKEVTATVDLTMSGRDIDFTVRATNNGTQNRYVSFEWSPRLASPGGDLARFRIPESGRLLAPATAQAEQGSTSAAPAEEAVGNRQLDQAFTRLPGGYVADGTPFRLQVGGRYYLAFQGVGGSLRSVRVRSDVPAHALQLTLSSFDPNADAEQRDQMLRAGQTLQWHFRMELMPLRSTPMSEDVR